MCIIHEISARSLSGSSTAANSHALRKRFPTYVSQARTPRVVNSETKVGAARPYVCPPAAVAQMGLMADECRRRSPAVIYFCFSGSRPPSASPLVDTPPIHRIHSPSLTRHPARRRAIAQPMHV
jgi:hypothetical protein